MNSIKRLIASVVVSILLVCLIASTGLHNGRRTDGLYYQVTGIHPDAELLVVNNEAVTAEEYFYWLDYVCGYLTASAGGKLDFSAPLSESASYGEYAKMDALNTVVLRASISSWAKENDIQLNKKDEKELEKRRQEYIQYYGGEEAYHQQLQLLGISEEQLNRIESAPLLYTHVQEAFCHRDGILYPGKEAIQQFGKENNYVTARLLYFSTVGMEQHSIDDVKEKAQSYARQLRQSDDVEATYEQLAKQLGLKTNSAGLTIHPGTSDPDVCAAIAKLDVGEISKVIRGENGFYVAVRMPLDTKSVAVELFNSTLQKQTESVKLEMNQHLYQQIDAGTFYQDLSAARADLQKEFSENSHPKLESPTK